ncbi:MAG: patatin-like phospholipase family protein, partial [Clostridia bacterium]|nr:patatin-like phospholipase family protein [Clostridia bacterium]
MLPPRSGETEKFMLEYGLALGGGGTKGAYHLGVWQALKDMKINVTCITGTSIGAINGAIIAQGDVDEAISIWKNISMSNILDTEGIENVTENLFDSKNIFKIMSAAYKNNGLETAPLRELLNSVIDEKKLRNSKIKFGLSTYSLEDFREIEVFLEDIEEGKAVDYLMASSS